MVAVEQEDSLNLLVELIAPARADAEPRPPATLEVVLDRSGSMGGSRLDGAKASLTALVDRLDRSVGRVPTRVAGGPAGSRAS